MKNHTLRLCLSCGRKSQEKFPFSLSTRNFFGNSPNCSWIYVCQSSACMSLHINLICKFSGKKLVLCVFNSFNNSVQCCSGNVCIAYVSSIKLKSLSQQNMEQFVHHISMESTWKTFFSFRCWSRKKSFCVFENKTKLNSPSQLHPINSARRQTVRSYWLYG